MIKMIKKQQNITCLECGTNIEHLKSKGGLFIANNLTTSCEECNLGKRDVLLEERQLNAITLKNE